MKAAVSLFPLARAQRPGYSCVMVFPNPRTLSLAAVLACVLSPWAAAQTTSQQALIDQYCVTCHNQTAMTGGLALDRLNLANVGADAGVWEKVVARLGAGMMPPSGAPRPDARSYAALREWLEGELDRAAVPYLPPPGLHRMNRTEYANAVRDLLDLKIDSAVLLPSDDSSHGFDNMAGTLGLSSTLVEAYISAAQKISRLAMGSDTNPLQVIYRAPEDTSQAYHVEGLPFGTRGGMRIEHEFPADGEYVVTVMPVRGDNMSPGPFGSVGGEKLEVLLDGEQIELADFPARGDGDLVVGFTTTAGLRTLGATFLETNFAPVLDIDRQFMRDTIQTGPFPGYTFFPHVGGVRIDGPFNGVAATDSPSRRRIFICTPAGPEDEPRCAREILTNLARQAYRRPVTGDDIDVLMSFFEAGRDEKGFGHGIETALARILASVQFVYRIEDEPGSLRPGDAWPITDLELASRLSFFLWSSIPDSELLEVGIAGRLRDPAVLERQVLRMLEDPRAEALAVNFAGQWLNLRGLGAVGPLPMLYPDFDDPLRQAMRREVELLFDAIVREDRNVLDLLDADYTFVNERLAKHYGIEGVYGSQFRRVTLPAGLDARRGLVGKGAVLTTTSKPERTSPVTRGKWIMTNILGVSPPDPPPDIAPLPPREDDAATFREPTMREQMQEHQVRPDCVQCHRLMDPIGFALENFDGIAYWRDLEGGSPIDASGTLYDGTGVDGPRELREWLESYSGQFARVVTGKLLTYALGRGVEYPDAPLVRSIAREAEGSDYRFSSFVLGVVRSDPFQMNMRLASGE